MPRPDTLSLSQARRIAIAAQGLAAAPSAAASSPAAPGLRQLTATARRLGVIQIDSVNVLARAHLMPLFSRLGPYDVALFHRLYSEKPRRLVETWAHEASFVPVETWPLLDWRRRAYREHSWGLISQATAPHPGIVESVRTAIKEDGPLTAAQVHADLLARGKTENTRKDTGWWNWTAAKRVLEYFFFTGEVSSAGRTPQFERRYDLTERVLPPEVLSKPIPDDLTAVRGLVEIAARAHGVAPARDLRDYFRLNRGVGKEQFAAALESLVAEQILQPVTVQGSAEQWYLHNAARLPRRVNRQTLLSPFDPLIWQRARLKELFGIDYRIEIYTPVHKRTHGYYVLPFLAGDQITARVDLKADRKAKGGAGALIVQAAHAENAVPLADYPEVAAGLGANLRQLADWLGLNEIVVLPRGQLAVALAGEVAGELAV